MRFPRISGNVQITEEKGTIVIAGDPEGLRTLGTLLTWLADAGLDEWPYLREGGRAHIHLYPKTDFCPDSRPAELMRLDAKGTGEMPEGFIPKPAK